ncbi:hypothetical protein CETAM_12675 [Corynebacterium comes]|uniref:Uncharacterized protein n=1 Tax=Corynebacterium comes TaxID=2675218 RepID=A0A6B8W4B5_9CORY|nr:hypothetical protein CETAM_12675 [Corynebacterium comes]
MVAPPTRVVGCDGHRGRVLRHPHPPAGGRDAAGRLAVGCVVGPADLLLLLRPAPVVLGLWWAGWLEAGGLADTPDTGAGLAVG